MILKKTIQLVNYDFKSDSYKMQKVDISKCFTNQRKYKEVFVCTGLFLSLLNFP